jgi:hypothetical protein
MSTEELVRRFITFVESHEGMVIGPGDSGRVFPLKNPEKDELVREFLATLPRETVPSRFERDPLV